MKKLLKILLTILLVLSATSFHIYSEFSSISSVDDKKQFIDNIEIQSKNIKQGQTTGTSAVFISPNSLAKLRQAQNALQQTQNTLKSLSCQYKSPQVTYNITSFTFKLQLDTQNQLVNIDDKENVIVEGAQLYGRFNFNYSIISQNRSVNGSGQGWFSSKSMMYGKQLSINSEGQLVWILSRKEGYRPIEINDGFHLTTITPFNVSDISMLSKIINQPSQFTQPSSIQDQFITFFNLNFPTYLNNSIFNNTIPHAIPYSFQHPVKGRLSMTVYNQLYSFSVDQINGFQATHVNRIMNSDLQTVCNQTVEQKHKDYKIYGGIQSLQLTCFHWDIANFMTKQGWLDVSLTKDQWGTQQFNFTAGQLFNVVNGLSTRVNPTQTVFGQCQPNPNSIMLAFFKEIESTQILYIQYNCSLKTRYKEVVDLQVLRFVSQMRILINVGVIDTKLDFTISNVVIDSLNFTSVNGLTVSNPLLAKYKIIKALEKAKNTKVFGTGYPTLPFKSPLIEIDKNFSQLVFYDAQAL